MRKLLLTVSIDAEIVGWLNTFNNKSEETNRILKLYYDNIAKKEIETVEQAMLMKADAQDKIRRLDKIIILIRADEKKKGQEK